MPPLMVVVKPETSLPACGSSGVTFKLPPHFWVLSVGQKWSKPGNWSNSSNHSASVVPPHPPPPPPAMMDTYSTPHHHHHRHCSPSAPELELKVPPAKSPQSSSSQASPSKGKLQQPKQQHQQHLVSFFIRSPSLILTLFLSFLSESEQQLSAHCLQLAELPS